MGRTARLSATLLAAILVGACASDPMDDPEIRSKVAEATACWPRCADVSPALAAEEIFAMPSDWLPPGSEIGVRIAGSKAPQLWVTAEQSTTGTGAWEGLKKGAMVGATPGAVIGSAPDPSGIILAGGVALAIVGGAAGGIVGALAGAAESEPALVTEVRPIEESLVAVAHLEGALADQSVEAVVEEAVINAATRRTSYEFRPMSGTQQAGVTDSHREKSRNTLSIEIVRFGFTAEEDELDRLGITLGARVTATVAREAGSVTFRSHDMVRESPKRIFGKSGNARTDVFRSALQETVQKVVHDILDAVFGRRQYWHKERATH